MVDGPLCVERASSRGRGGGGGGTGSTSFLKVDGSDGDGEEKKEGEKKRGEWRVPSTKVDPCADPGKRTRYGRCLGKEPDRISTAVDHFLASGRSAFSFCIAASCWGILITMYHPNSSAHYMISSRILLAVWLNKSSLLSCSLLPPGWQQATLKFSFSVELIKLAWPRGQASSAAVGRGARGGARPTRRIRPTTATLWNLSTSFITPSEHPRRELEDLGNRHG